ncbi:beta strand repeat-containing protein [Sapientia aquatica]|uniref:Big-1 domain-containing protein n=1 Tax=Sapientia aquatica TaxID=1549640 RepID=A0A4R5W2D8_9BURK|nr:hypothetical protein [Sapientia aquatica]TDK65927.1 hypothetical protein E2I14_10025 [Sapientia aquatica]
MKLNFKGIFTARYWTLLVSAILLAVVAACGGGNGSAGTPLGGSGSGSGTGGGTTTNKNGAIVLTLTDSTGANATAIPSGASLTAQAKLTNASGGAVVGVVVTFAVSNSAGVLSPSLGTALSDSNGVAVITLSSGSGAGAATLTASATIVGTAAVTSSIGFTNGAVATATSSPVLKLTLKDSSGATSSTVSTASPLTASATVVDGTGAGIPNVLVTFSSTATLTKIAPSASTAVTNSNGVATVTISPLDLATAQSQAGAAGTVVAIANYKGTNLSDSANFSLGATSQVLSLALVTPSPNPSSLGAYASTAVQVSVSANGALYTAQPVVVNFSSSCATSGKAVMPSSAVTVNGVAAVTYKDNGCGTTDVVSATVAGVATPVTATLNVVAPVAASINFVSAAPSDKSIVLQGSGGNGRSETAILTFKVVDINGVGLKGQTVTFTNNFPTIATLNTASAVSQTDGTVTATVNSQSTAGTFRILATLASGLSSLSDTITVTTGQPIQAAFSLSATSYNIEGWDNDNIPSNLGVLIADKNGNPVADGTPVVATTDSGAVGSSAVGGCQNGTINGSCSVPFRSQNPRYGLGNTAGKRAGLATIQFNSSNSTTLPLTGQLQVYLSGNTVAHVYSGGTEIFSGAAFTTNSCSIYNLNLEFEDLNFNPMPSGSTVSVINPLKVAAGTIFPALVPSIPPNGLVPASAANRQGSTHNIPLTPDSTNCNAAGSGTYTSTFQVAVTTPLGKGTVYTFSLVYPH